MDNKANDGGPAFPVQSLGIRQTGTTLSTASRGMTLRDWFAGQALAGLMAADIISESTKLVDIPGNGRANQVAWLAYKAADAMLEERAKGDKK